MGLIALFRTLAALPNQPSDTHGLRRGLHSRAALRLALHRQNLKESCPTSREAAQECSPRRKPWVMRPIKLSPIGAKECMPHVSRERLPLLVRGAFPRPTPDVIPQ
jgi:hypothetical protein